MVVNRRHYTILWLRVASSASIKKFKSFLASRKTPTEKGEDITIVVTVKLDVVAQCRDEDEDEDGDKDGELLESTSILGLRKFWEFFLMALQVNNAISA